MRRDPDEGAESKVREEADLPIAKMVAGAAVVVFCGLAAWWGLR